MNIETKFSVHDRVCVIRYSTRARVGPYVVSEEMETIRSIRTFTQDEDGEVGYHSDYRTEQYHAGDIREGLIYATPELAQAECDRLNKEMR